MRWRISKETQFAMVFLGWSAWCLGLGFGMGYLVRGF